MIENELKGKIYTWFRDTSEIDLIKRCLEQDDVNKIRQVIDDYHQEIFYGLCKEIHSEQDIIEHNTLVQKITNLNIIDQEIMEILHGQLDRGIFVETHQ